MRIIVILIFILLGNNVSAQNDIFELNFEPDPELDSTSIFNLLVKDFDEIVGFNKECYWGTVQILYILAKKESKWKAYKVSITYKENWPKTIANIKKMSIRRRMVNKEKLNSFFQLLIQYNFFSLKEDSLNIFSKINKIAIPISDGCNEQFQFCRLNKYKNLKSYEPDYYQKEISTGDRDIFIGTRNQYLKLFRRK